MNFIEQQDINFLMKKELAHHSGRVYHHAEPSCTSRLIFPEKDGTVQTFSMSSPNISPERVMTGLPVSLIFAVCTLDFNQRNFSHSARTLSDCFSE